MQQWTNYGEISRKIRYVNSFSDLIWISLVTLKAVTTVLDKQN